MLINENPFLQNKSRQEKAQNNLPQEENNISFDKKFYKDIDTSELVKRRQENEAYLEEIEK